MLVFIITQAYYKQDPYFDWLNIIAVLSFFERPLSVDLVVLTVGNSENLDTYMEFSDTLVVCQ